MSARRIALNQFPLAGSAIGRIPARTARRAGRALLAALANMAEAIRTRRMLARLDDRMLSDIGISRVDALKEAARRPWDNAAPR